MSKITQTHNYVSFALSRAYAHIDKSYRLFAVTSVTDYRQKATYQPLTRSIHNYFGIKFSLLLSPRCFIKGKLLCYFRYSTSVTYFGTLLSPSSSGTYILSHYQALIRRCCKNEFCNTFIIRSFFHFNFRPHCLFTPLSSPCVTDVTEKKCNLLGYARA